MKSTVAFSQLLMLSTSLLCLSSVAAQTPDSSGDFGIDGAAHLGVTTTAQQEGSAKRQQGAPSQVNRAQKKKNTCRTADNPHRFEIKHIEAKGIGYDQGYTSLDAFLTGNVCNFIPFIDLRAHVFNNGRWASNAGIGTRYIIDPCKSMFGINAYYDYRKTKHSHYNQVGAGIEAYYDRFEFLANGYLPVGRKRMRTSHELQSITFNSFSGNYILYDKNYKNKYEGAMKGFNAEVGAHFLGDMKNYDVYFGIGPYYYDLKEGKHTWGGKARLKFEASRFLFLELSDSWDNIFHNRFQGTVNLSIPFGVRKCYGKKRTSNNCSNVMDWLATLPVDRQEIVVLDKYKKKSVNDPVAIDPTTGKPFFVTFVKNDNLDTGVGTFEDPVTCLSILDATETLISPTPVSAQAAAPANTIIYVFPGDGTNARMSTGTALRTGQRLLGSAIAHTVVTTDGVLTIPPQSTVTPFITGTSTGTMAVPTAPAVTIDAVNSVPANNCEVSGFRIAMQTPFPAGNQALSTASVGCIAVAQTINVSNVSITNNSMVNENWGVVLGNATTPSLVQGNVNVSNNIISMHAGTGTPQSDGIHLTACRQANVVIANNDISFGVAGGTGSNGIFARGADQVQVSILNNHINGVASSGILQSIQDVTGTVPASTATFIIQGNTITNVGTTGINALSTMPATMPGSNKLIIENNTVINAAASSLVTVNAGSATQPNSLLLRFNGNTMPALTLTTSTANSLLYLEPPINNTTLFTITPLGTAIIPIVPCQYGGPGCP